MNSSFSIIEVNSKNFEEHPQVICYINPKHPSYPLKIEWLKKRFKEGLVVKLLYLKGERRAAGFIEFVPGEKCWRTVTAPGYLFIHCIWINAVKNKNQGLGSALIDSAITNAKEKGFSGVAVLTSSGSFMADRTLFEKNGFKVVASDPPFDLLVMELKKGPVPVLNDRRTQLKRYQGLHIIYSRQCPWVARFVSEIGETVKKHGLSVTVTELTTPEQAQAAPSPYSVFNLVYNGKILADHYISETRFLNIIRKEFQGKEK